MSWKKFRISYEYCIIDQYGKNFRKERAGMFFQILLIVIGVLLLLDGIRSVRLKNKGIVRLSKALKLHLKARHIRNIGYFMIAIGLILIITGIYYLYT